MSKNIKNVPTQDYEDAVVTVALYVEGLRMGNVTVLSQAFHKDATMYGYPDGKLLHGPIKNRCVSYYADNGSTARRHGE